MDLNFLKKFTSGFKIPEISPEMAEKMIGDARKMIAEKNISEKELREKMSAIAKEKGIPEFMLNQAIKMLMEKPKQ